MWNQALGVRPEDSAYTKQWTPETGLWESVALTLMNLDCQTGTETKKHDPDSERYFHT